MKKINTILLAVLLLLSMAGCQLARTETEETKDRMVGVLITRDYLDLFDMDAYLEDNLRITGGEIIIDGDTSAYEGRIYASFVPKTLYGENGETMEDEDLLFSDLEGIHYVAARMKDENGAYNRVYSSDGLLNGQASYHSTDFEDSVSLEGEIWLVQGTGDLMAYINPVYQDDDGNFYVTPGQGFHSSGDSGTGSLFTQTMEDSSTVTKGSITTTISNSITISIGIKPKPLQYRLLQMREDNTILSSRDYTPGEMPQDLTVSEDAAYLLLETHQQNSDTVRTIINPDEDHISTLYAGEDGYLLEDITFLHWE